MHSCSSQGGFFFLPQMGMMTFKGNHVSLAVFFLILSNSSIKKAWEACFDFVHIVSCTILYWGFSIQRTWSTYLKTHSGFFLCCEFDVCYNGGMSCSKGNKWPVMSWNTLNKKKKVCPQHLSNNTSGRALSLHVQHSSPQAPLHFTFNRLTLPLVVLQFRALSLLA